MSTYLELCQQVARESGTVPTIGDPGTVTGQTDDRLQQVIWWTSRAYVDIQNSRSDWLWLRSTFSGTTISGTQSYDASALGIASRFGRWHMPRRRGQEGFTCYLTSDGQSTEEALVVERDYDRFYTTFQIGDAATQTGRPQHMTIDPSQNILLHPTPDGNYTIRGHYWKAPQELTDDGDTPEMPSAFHDAIMYRALMHLAAFDEAPMQWSGWRSEYDNLMNDLVAHQTLPWHLGRPLA